ncbi:MAG: hypothetical protein ACI9DF_000259 [Verrucomicrobiales bacterium]|jgi:hypothetical protein
MAMIAAIVIGAVVERGLHIAAPAKSQSTEVTAISGTRAWATPAGSRPNLETVLGTSRFKLRLVLANFSQEHRPWNSNP